MTVTLPPGVGWTSLLTTYARAQEQRRADRTFDDPWAALFIEAALATPSDGALPPLGPARADGSSQLWNMFAEYFTAGRTPFFDEHVLGGVAAGAGQVVILAAGMDARSARLPLPEDMPVFEVDTAPVLEFKRSVLDTAGADSPRRRPVVADLREHWPDALTGAGFRAGAPTVWVIEGLLMYLDTDAADTLLGTVAQLSGPGSRVAVEYFSRVPDIDSVPPGDEAERRWLEMLVGLFRTGPGTDPASWLGRLGLEPGIVTDVPGELRRHGRAVPAVLDPAVTPDPMAIALATATLGR